MPIEHNAASLPRSTPEAQGIASAAILAFVNDLVENVHEAHSLMLLRHGEVVCSLIIKPKRIEIYGSALEFFVKKRGLGPASLSGANNADISKYSVHNE
jgi:hypothetical protein